MSETTKTGVFGVAALLALVVSLVARPAAPGRADHDDSGERFFATFDPLEAASLEIIGAADDDAGIAGFKVAQIDGRWAIPSHENYPADAADQLAGAAADVADIVKGPRVSDNPSDHALFGVVDPVGADDGAAGLGTRITIRDGGNGVLADLIVGKPVKDAPDLRYVRAPGRDRVYTAKVDTARLTTAFESWIEEDLLRIDPVEISEIIINDYYVDEINGQVVERETAELAYDESTASWTMAELAEGEQLRKDKVRAITRALDDLRIVDVHRKPEGLSAELRAADSMQLDASAVRSLQQRGFYVDRRTGRLLSNEGETIVRMKSGINYVLRFGEIAQERRAAGGLDDDPGAEGSPDEPPEGASRYLFVMAGFDPTALPEPDYEPVPEPAAPDADGAEDAEPAPGDAERQRILEENERKLDEWEQKVAEGEALVQELNERFADWYYVIPDSTYRDIRLTRDDLVEAAEATPAAADGVQTPEAAPDATARPPEDG